MNCPKCNQFVPDGSRFCQSCGTNLLEAAVDAAAGVEPAVADIVDGPAPASPTQEPAVEKEEPEEQTPDVAQAEPAAEMAMGGASAQAVNAGEPYTGQQMASGQGQTVYGQPAGGYVQPAAVGATVAKKGLSKPVLFGIIGGGIFLVAAAITLVIVFLVVGNKTAYKLSDYTEVTFEGVDGSGTVEVKLKDDLIIELADNMGVDLRKMRDSDGTDWGNVIKMATKNLAEIMTVYAAIKSVDLTPDKKENLKNGDTVTVTYTFDEEKAKAAKAEFIADPLTVTVSGLSEVKEIDPFESLEVSFEGASPNAYVTYENKGTEEPLNYIWFDTDSRDGLKLGDTVTLKVEGYEEESFIKNYGVKFSQTEKTYTVENVDAFITENKELDAAALEVMKPATEGYIDEYFNESSRKEAVKATDISFVGYYLLTNKNTDVWLGYNKVYMIYSATVSSKEKDKQFKPTTVFFPVEYDDIKLLADGTYEINTEYKRILGSTDLKFGFWQTVSGYQDMEMMYDELVTAEGADYEGAVYENQE